MLAVFLSLFSVVTPVVFFLFLAFIKKCLLSKGTKAEKETEKKRRQAEQKELATATIDYQRTLGNIKRR
jgi:hypothetical protein